MPQPNSQDTFREAGHQGMEALRNAGHGFADFGHAISDAWGVGVKLRIATVQATCEAGQTVERATVHALNAAGTELAKENKEIVHGAQEIGKRAVHGAHVVGKELQREGRLVVHGTQELGKAVIYGAPIVRNELQREARAVVHNVVIAGEAVEAVAHGVQAGAKRIGDHIHDRPLTAIIEGPFAIIDGLARGGIEKSHDQLAHNRGAEKPQEKQAPAHHLQKNTHNTHVLHSLEIKY
jgi:hypothetical protein